MSNWVKLVLNKATKEYHVIVKPNFADISKTDFPDGLPIFFNKFQGKRFAHNHLQEAIDFFEEFQSGYMASRAENKHSSYKDFFLAQYKESIHYYNENGTGYFASAYRSTRNENDIFEYPRLASHFVDEYTDFPHGITIGTQKFYENDNRKTIVEHIKLIDNFVFHILDEYEKTL